MTDDTKTTEATAQQKEHEQQNIPQTEDSPVVVELADKADTPQHAEALDKACDDILASLPPVMQSLYPKDMPAGQRLTWLAAALKVSKEDSHIVQAMEVTPPRQMAPKPDLNNLPVLARIAAGYKNTRKN